MKMLTPHLGTCRLEQLGTIKKFLHPARSRSDLIFAAGALGNKNLERQLGSQELSTFYDGMVAAGRLKANPYWREHSRD
jgi:hypothetical protein